MFNCNHAFSFTLLALGVAQVAIAQDDAGGSSSSITLQSVVENVRAHEGLYSRLESLAVSEYQLQLPEGHSWRHADFILSETRRHHEVVDGARRSIESEKRGTNVAGENLDEDYRYGFDGTRTRILMQRPEHGLSIGNLQDGSANAAYQFRPHTVLLQKAFIGDMRLSEYLACDGYHNYHFRASIIGEEMLSLNDRDSEALRCLKLKCETWVDGQDEPDFRYLWLAVDCNYLPVKSVFYAVGYSRDVPVEIDSVLELREVAEGVYFPVNVEIQTYYERDAAAGKTTPGNLIAVSVEEVDLDPVVSDELFSAIAFPEGTLVYELDASGELINSFTVGHSMTGESGESLVKSIILLSSIAIIAVLVYFALRAWRKRPARA